MYIMDMGAILMKMEIYMRAILNTDLRRGMASLSLEMEKFTMESLKMIYLMV